MNQVSQYTPKSVDRELVEYFRSAASDVYLQRAHDTLAAEGIDLVVQMEFFPERTGVLCGIAEALDRHEGTTATLADYFEHAAQLVRQVVPLLRPQT